MSAPHRHYVDNRTLTAALIAWRASAHAADAAGTERPAIPDEIGAAVLRIAQGLASKPQFVRHPLRDDLISSGVVQALSVLDRFDPTKSRNAFSFLTQVIYHAFLQALRLDDIQDYRRLQLAQHLTDHGWDGRQYLDDHAESLAYHTERAARRRERTRQRRAGRS